MKTRMIKKSELNPKWHHIDADGKVVGRLAAEIVKILTGKNDVNYSPYINLGHKVVITNSKKVVFTGSKELNKFYFRHSGQVGNAQYRTVAHLRETNPNRILMEAVKGMLPKNRLAKERMANLYIYEGPEHPHQGQINSESK